MGNTDDGYVIRRISILLQNLKGGIDVEHSGGWRVDYSQFSSLAVLLGTMPGDHNGKNDDGPQQHARAPHGEANDELLPQVTLRGHGRLAHIVPGTLHPHSILETHRGAGRGAYYIIRPILIMGKLIHSELC